MTVPDGPTSTPIWGLEKPGGEEKIDVLEAIHRNMDRLDKVGRKLCTSTSRPTGPALFEGLCIYEVDTQQQWTYSSGGWCYDGITYVEFTFAVSAVSGVSTNVGAFTLVAGTAKGKQFYSSPSVGRLTLQNTTPRSQYYAVSVETSADGPCGARAFLEVANTLVARQRIIDPEQTAQIGVPVVIVQPNQTRSFDVSVFHSIGVVRGFTGIIRLHKLAD